MLPLFGRMPVYCVWRLFNMEDFKLNNEKIPKCKHCGRPRASHKADSLNCPFGKSRNFPNYRADQFYSPVGKLSQLKSIK